MYYFCQNLKENRVSPFSYNPQTIISPPLNDRITSLNYCRSSTPGFQTWVLLVCLGQKIEQWEWTHNYLYNDTWHMLYYSCLDRSAPHHDRIAYSEVFVDMIHVNFYFYNNGLIRISRASPSCTFSHLQSALSLEDVSRVVGIHVFSKIKSKLRK